jgi:hypothetical protein
MRIVRATLDTINFHFEAYGETAEAARNTLIWTLAKHGEQYRLNYGWYEDYISDGSWIEYFEFAVGDGFRDRHELVKR